MEIRQLRSLLVLVDTGFSVSRAAEHLHLVQSAISQQLGHLEEELGVRIFKRQGRRLTGLTDVGHDIVEQARRAMSDIGNIKRIGKEYVGEISGVLRIGTTHTQARYVLPPVIKQFRRAYPEVELEIHQGTPGQLVEMAAKESVDFSICTEALAEHPGLEVIPCYEWNRCLIALPEHPLFTCRRITLKSLCEHPLITYVFGFTGRSHMSDTFSAANLSPRVVLSAADTDVIKTYVREGMGVGIIATIAFSREQDKGLAYRDLGRLFPWETTKIAYRKDKYLRQFQREFIEIFQGFVTRQGKKTGMRQVRTEVAIR